MFPPPTKVTLGTPLLIIGQDTYTFIQGFPHWFLGKRYSRVGIVYLFIVI